MPEVKSTDHYLPPLREDFEGLLGRFQLTESVRYEHFAPIWREMNLSSIHYGIPQSNEKRLFTKQALSSAYPYLLPPYNFQIRVGGLYLLYGLYSSQLAWPREKIWVALKDWDNIQEFIQNAWEGQHLDVVYVYWRLQSGKAFLYSAMPVPLLFEKRRPVPKPQGQELPTERPERVKTFVSLDTNKEMRHIQERYEKMKVTLSLTSTVSATQRDVVKLMQNCAQEYERQQDSKNASKDCADYAVFSEREESSKRAQLLESIKSKSYGLLTEASKSRRHRQVEGEVTSSVPDPYAEYYASGKKRTISLKARTCRALGEEGKRDPTHHWLLSAAENDKAALKRKTQKGRFKW
ncbi:snRNA-activating protein complex subunit 1a [Clupea harengus]|uniref:snRNA-activating protein complex subunit 1a n=1 Tax=Clupea harengus TaxID=7950 RepID=A0A6P3VTQ2_CLUHA|nr:snRNA-activating protein complex subunit 1a [Clupea harengus]